ncbi:MAG: trigger factor [Pseudomonadota bacterium]
MQISVASISKLERKMSVTVPAKKVEEEVNSRLISLQKTFKMQGFREGKVPLKIIKQKFSVKVAQEVMGDLMQQTYQQAIQEKELKPVTGPTITPKAIEVGKDLKYEAIFDVYPDFKTKGVHKIKISEPETEISQKDVADVVEKLCKQKRQWDKSSGAAKKGSQLDINFEGKIDGNFFEGGQAENFTLVIGEGALLDDFESQLIDLKRGDVKNIDVKFPKDYHTKKLSGKKATFSVTVNNVYEGTAPTVNESFVKSLGIEDGNIETLHENIKKGLEMEKAKLINRYKKDQIMEGLLKNNKIDIPKSLIAQEIKLMKQQDMQNNTHADEEESPDSLFQIDAEKRVKLGMILGKIIEEQKITLDQKRVQDTIHNIAGNYNDPQQVISHYNEDTKAKASIEAVVMEEQVVEWALQFAKSSTKKMTFSQLSEITEKLGVRS